VVQSQEAAGRRGRVLRFFASTVLLTVDALESPERLHFSLLSLAKNEARDWARAGALGLIVLLPNDWEI
jgi:hypothetical protein